MCCRNSNSAKPLRPPVNALGIWGFFVSLFGLVFTLGLLSPIGLILSLLAMFHPRRGFAVAGFVVGMVGTALIAAIVGTAAVATETYHHYAHEVPQIEQTLARLDDAIVVIETDRREKGELPEGVDGNKLVLPITDAWQQSVRYEPEDSGIDYAVRSAGPDMKFDTADDLRMVPTAH
ncbi:DUF4190 domain-containing protein [Blastopirellula sp. JC732]|uniref:DUF4190 domain-containing protein n=1 Tax=Blastopirellula sediminis TaxID=2894196 RepID=A0A9X1MTI8_9BACT|nr:DUF4190 domain-containing protein [Blastopirellula sediminis]MCC9604481.1 DUF4190 domain-containing protein [Blastopirellula sediminis]MCC9632220.1 DUF4190 domain-containing protein [Blastopirellula sediminis]